MASDRHYAPFVVLAPGDTVPKSTRVSFEVAAGARMEEAERQRWAEYPEVFNVLLKVPGQGDGAPGCAARVATWYCMPCPCGMLHPECHCPSRVLSIS